MLHEGPVHRLSLAGGAAGSLTSGAGRVCQQGGDAQRGNDNPELQDDRLYRELGYYTAAS
jgi:hypothetical protein